MEYGLALPHSAQPADSGDMSAISRFVQVTSAVAAVALQVYSMEIIIGCGYVSPEGDTSSKTENGQKE